MKPHINQNLRIAIVSKGLTQRKVAFVIGISESLLSSIINGYKKPTKELTNKLSDLLGVSTNQLFTNDI